MSKASGKVSKEIYLWNILTRNKTKTKNSNISREFNFLSFLMCVTLEIIFFFYEKCNNNKKARPCDAVVKNPHQFFCLPLNEVRCSVVRSNNTSLKHWSRTLLGLHRTWNVDRQFFDKNMFWYKKCYEKDFMSKYGCWI